MKLFSELYFGVSELHYKNKRHLVNSHFTDDVNQDQRVCSNISLECHSKTLFSPRLMHSKFLLVQNNKK